MKQLYFIPKVKTNSNCTYVTLDESDMNYLIRRVTLLLANYAELSITNEGLDILTQRDGKKFGKRGRASTGNFKPNSRLSLLGGVLTNYYNKEQNFKNDISEGQLKYIANVINECSIEMKYDSIEFINRLG